ncbi:hypothetical protein M569_14073 [Genlisea aurea]|uniref:Uncharacterized protein n=1 Tax=Genlisea aurea TaxID=192259 RepID=S8C200_9LAMI|nr:hypothetical protein M569_14073 [Genlisea aurea]
MGKRNAVTGALNSGLERKSSEIPANDEPTQVSGDVEVSSAAELPVLIPDNEVSGTALFNDSDHHGNEDEKSPTTESRKGKRKLSVFASSSRSLRSRSLEEPKPPEPVEMVKEEGSDGETRKRGRKKLDKGSSQNEFSRVRRHLGYLLHRIKYEQSLIDAYCAEGWKKQSLEKLKPEKEIQHAKSNILRYKLKVRSLFQHLDQLLSVGRLPDSLFDSEGEIDSEDV